jgi:transcriptional regulator with XRE-family HTH domain
MTLSIRAQLGLNRETFARLVPVSTRTLAAIEAGQTPGEGVARKLTEIERLVDALSNVIRGDEIGPWLIRPNDAFGGLKPLEVIERGEIDRLWRMAYEVGTGMPG